MSNYTKATTGRTAGKKQVNPTYSAKAPSAKSPSGKQVNVTVSGKQPSGSGHRTTEVNKSFSVAHNTTSKGTAPAKLIARKGPVGKPQVRGTGKANVNAKMGPVTRNQGTWPAGTPDTTHSTDHPQGVRDRGTTVPNRNENAPIGMNPGARNRQNMTVQRLKGLGY